MQIIENPDRKDWSQLLKRPYVENRAVLESVQSILNGVRQHGDEALRGFTKKFDGYEPEQFEVSKGEMENADREISPGLIRAIEQAKTNIETFHRKQISRTEVVEIAPGIQCWRKFV